MKQKNVLMQGIEIGMAKSKEVLEVLLIQLRELESKSENIVYIKNSEVIGITPDIKLMIAQIEDHIISEYGDVEAMKLGIDITSHLHEREDY